MNNLSNPVEYKGKFICETYPGSFRIKNNPADDYATHHGSYDSAEKAMAAIDKQTGSMSNHTKEPWYVNPYDVASIHGPDNTGIADLRFKDGYQRTNAEANARRIVACVNACVGLETKELEVEGLYRLSLKKVDHMIKLEKQHAELLAAINKYLKGDYPNPQNSESNRCKHLVNYWHTCDKCISEHFNKAIASVEHK